jgi:hypothetical protein
LTLPAEKEKDSLDSDRVFVVTPRMISKFSPVITIGRSPAMKKKLLDTDSKKSKNVLSMYTRKDKIEPISEEPVEEKLLQVKRKMTSYAKVSLKSLKNEEVLTKFKLYQDLPITDGVKIDPTNDNMKKSNTEPVSFSNDDLFTDDKEEIEHEGFWYSENKELNQEKQWFKLFKKDLCCINYYNLLIGYESKEANAPKSVSNLSGVFTEETESILINDEIKFGLQLIFSSEILKYYMDSAEQRDVWLTTIRRATGYTNIKDIYEELVIFFIK